MFNTIINFFMKMLGLGEQIAENKGEKIPMQKEQIESKSGMKAQKYYNKKGELVERGKQDDWIPKVEFFRDELRWIEMLRAKKQVRNLLDAGGEITSIDMQTIDEKRWLVITYNEGKSIFTYKVLAKQNNGL